MAFLKLCHLQGVSRRTMNCRIPCLIAILFLLPVLCPTTGCSSGYTKSNGSWTYVVYAGDGREVRKMIVDHKTFKVLDRRYAKDKYQVYWGGVIMEGLDGESFELFSDPHYSKDKNGVYYQDAVILDADPQSFRLIKGPYSRDDAHFYCGNLRMDVAHPEKFEVLSGVSSGGHYFYSTQELVEWYGDDFADREVKYDRQDSSYRDVIITADEATATDGIWLYEGPKRARKVK